MASVNGRARLFRSSPIPKWEALPTYTVHHVHRSGLRKSRCLSTSSRPVFRTMVQIDSSWPAQARYISPCTNYSSSQIFFLVEYQARHSLSITYRLVIHRQQLTHFSYPNHPCLNSGQSTPCLLPTMAYASDACFHLSTACCTHAPPHALVLRSGLGYRSSSSPFIPARPLRWCLVRPLDVFPDRPFLCHSHAV